MNFSGLKKCFALIIIVSLFSFSVHASQVAPSGLQMISTADAVNELTTQQDIKSIQEFMNLEEVQAQLVSLGVSPDEAMKRVEALSHDERRHLVEQIESSKAGAGTGAIIGAVVFIFIVLLITDILGFTKFFPFTRSIR